MVQNGRKNFPVSALTVPSDLAQLAVGFANGAVTVVRGDLIHDRGTRQRTVFESEEPITGLEFREANTTALYISTTSRISALAVSGKGQGTPARTLDEHGCAVGCMTLDPETNEIVVAIGSFQWGCSRLAREKLHWQDKAKVVKANKMALSQSLTAAELSRESWR